MKRLITPQLMGIHCPIVIHFPILVASALTTFLFRFAFLDYTGEVISGEGRGRTRFPALSDGCQLLMCTD